MSVDLAVAQAIVASGTSRAAELGLSMTVAVVDSGGHLVALARMDEASLASLDIAIGKAYTAVALKMDTGDVAALVQPGQPLYGMDTVHVPRPLVPFGGGLPLRVGTRLVGGVGVSGGSVEQDDLVAQAAIVALR
ncbi:GlcG/HbpS family heme-binding protein [Phytohabitans suffuscus]|uniref:PduO protein n=1 Tax=Phytohabitans suffuscus TaxID=624315 RepID=A0A6F8YEK5_9ACTN|nr:heme-binding protein [Phytohabitans suffuscus]BCB84532.1 PduO protein [Phytohabitans suffuscus]